MDELASLVQSEMDVTAVAVAGCVVELAVGVSVAALVVASIVVVAVRSVVATAERLESCPFAAAPAVEADADAAFAVVAALA